MEKKKSEKVRVNAYLVPEAVKYLDEQCEKYGMNRGSFITFALLERQRADSIASTVSEFQKELKEFERSVVKPSLQE